MKKTRTSGHLPRTSTFPDKDRTPEKEGRCRGGFMEPQKFNARGNFGNRWGKGGSEIYSVYFCFPEAWAIEETYLRLIILDEWGQESYPQRVREKLGARWHSGKEPACQCMRHKRWGFDPWVGKIPCSGAQQPTPVFLPGESHRQRRLAGYSPWGHEESDTTETKHSSSLHHFQHGKYIENDPSTLTWKRLTRSYVHILPESIS